VLKTQICVTRPQCVNGLSKFQITQDGHRNSMCTGWYQRQNFWSWDCFPQLLKYQDFWSIRSQLGGILLYFIVLILVEAVGWNARLLTLFTGPPPPKGSQTLYHTALQIQNKTDFIIQNKCLSPTWCSTIKHSTYHHLHFLHFPILLAFLHLYVSTNFCLE